MRRFSKKGAIALPLIVLALGWWWMSWDFEDTFVSGSYVERSAGECNSLILNSDHSFRQEFSQGDLATIKATGKWSRFGEAGVAFSTTFLGASPEAITGNNVYGTLDNTFGYHTLTIESPNHPLMFHKRVITFTAACSL